MNVLDLFSGIGGFSLGLERAGMKTVAFCEIEEFPKSVLRKHWPDVPIFEDVRNVTKQSLEANGITRIDVVTGGFPCQDLSCAGKQAGITGKRSGLWAELHRIIGEVRPKYGIMENVSNLLSGDNGAWFATLLRDLAEIGYDAEWHCIPAAYCGHNHSRDRAWIVAYPQRNGNDKHVGKRRVQIGRALFHELPYIWDKKIIGKNWIESKLVFGRVAPSEWRCEGLKTETRPLLLRDDDGIPGRLDKRLKACGNSVVPQIPEIIGREIIRHNRRC